MKMHFHFTLNEMILFEGWTATDWQGIFGSAVGILIMAIFYEGLKNYREYLFVSAAVAAQKKSPGFEKASLLSGVHLWQSFLHFVQIIIGYFLMLIFMTYNVYLCAAVAIGGALGFWLFAWRKASSDITDCCN